LREPTSRETQVSQGPPDWETLEEGDVRWSRVFGVQDVVRRSPRTGRTGTFQVIHTSAWCNVVALTPDDEVVLIRQFRHGLGGSCVEIPGGLVDPGEDPMTAAVRELLEETGYAGDAAAPLGFVHPNPALMGNRCSTFLVTNARLIAEPMPDEEEDITVELVPLAEIPSWIARGDITHAMVIAAFWHLLAATGKPLPEAPSID